MLEFMHCKISRFIKKEITMITVDKFNVRVVNKGDKYGRDFCLTHEEDKPLVEFYDSRYPHTDFGQFITRYYVATILGKNAHRLDEETGALHLDLGIPAWTVSERHMDIVRAYLKGATE
jgi:hypothetical protein